MQQQQANTQVKSYEMIDIVSVVRLFAGDLSILALQTEGMTPEDVKSTTSDITTMAIQECLARVDVQLFDKSGERVLVYSFWVKNYDGVDPDKLDFDDENKLKADTRFDTNGWRIVLILWPSDPQKVAELQNNDRLLNTWSTTDHDTDYSNMSPRKDNRTGSAGYRWIRKTYRDRDVEPRS